MKKSLGATIGEVFRLNLEKITRNFFILTIASVIVGIVIYLAVSSIWDEVRTVKEGSLPQLIQSQQTDIALEGINLVLEKLFDAEEPGVRAILLATVKETNSIYEAELRKLLAGLERESEEAVKQKLIRASNEYISVFEAGVPEPDEVFPKLTALKDALTELRNLTLTEIEADFAASESAKNKATLVIVLLTVAAIGGMITTSLVLTGVVSQPVASVADGLAKNSRDIEDVFSEISEGAQKQTTVVKQATEDLEDMIINIIQGSITMSVEKQAEIAGVFADFLRQFVERTSAEIAMGIMSVSQQAQEARSGMQDFVKELGTVEGNIKTQESSVEGIVKALKEVVDSNKDIKEKAAGSTKAADEATGKAYEGQERIELISKELVEVRNASEGVREITESLAKITENIKILALNMSLKVEDIRDDTGKSYGFEAMSARVQELAEEVEGLLVNSRDMIIPTIEAIEKVSTDADQTRELITDVAGSIKVADDESKAIAREIDRQTGEIDRVEQVAENLRELARKSTKSIVSQMDLVKNVDELLAESVTLIESVNEQTQDASEGARKVNEMMEELKASMANIEEGTGKLTEKSVELSDVFGTISEQAERNLGGAERLEMVTTAVRDVTRRLAVVVRGSADSVGVQYAEPKRVESQQEKASTEKTSEQSTEKAAEGSGESAQA